MSTALPLSHAMILLSAIKQWQRSRSSQCLSNITLACYFVGIKLIGLEEQLAAGTSVGQEDIGETDKSHKNPWA